MDGKEWRSRPLPVDRVIGRRLAGARAARCLALDLCARALGLTEEELYASEQGVRPLLAREIYCAGVRLDVPLSEFFTGLEPAPPPRWMEEDEEAAIRRLAERLRRLSADARRLLLATAGAIEEAELLSPILLAERPCPPEEEEAEEPRPARRRRR